MSLRPQFRTGYDHLDYQELISSRADALIGVSPSASEALKQLGIETVFDLGSSRFFSNARSVSDYGSIKDLSVKFGMVPSDWVDTGTNVEALDDLGSLGIARLRDVDTALAKKISAAFDVETIKELAYWPPYHAANQIVRDFAGSTMSAEDLQSEELRPRLGEYPTERVYYDTLVMLQLPMKGPRKPLDGPLSLAGLAIADRETRPVPAIGALLTYSQSWNAQGLTLGHLLHSLALAPGESTRIAMIDWSRKSSAGASESITESDVLNNATNHSRAISEVQNSVASEMQSGGSKSSSSSKSAGGGASVSAPIPAGGVPVSVGLSGQFGKTSGKAESTSWSIGTRSVGASMSQNVNDRTEQHAASVRNRRASAVREVSQSEHEQVSTRIVANYNHMHALTIQYFEVVQIYRVTVKFHKAQRCLMIPMDVIDFSDPRIVERFREELHSVALLPDLFDLSEQSSLTMAITSTAQLPDSGLSNLWAPQEVANVSAQIGAAITKPNDPQRIYLPEGASLISISVENGVFGPEGIQLFYHDPIPATGKMYATLTIKDSGAYDFGTVALSELSYLSLNFGTGDIDKTLNFKLRLGMLINGSVISLPAVIITPNQWRNGKFTCLTFKSNPVELTPIQRAAKLTAHLKANADYYSAAIYRNMDDATMFSLLNQYNWNGKPLAAQVEPRPFTVAGNYLVFMAPVDMDEPSGIKLKPDAVAPDKNNASTLRKAAGEAALAAPVDQQFADIAKRFEGPPTWEKLLTERNIIGPNAKSDERLVPIPTTGVFAEAVLGRSNSAEKLDITRFWNWQDSPIPLSAPEIAAIQMGSRAQAENLMPGQLGQPGVTIVNPTQLPDPAGLAAVIGAVQNGNMFRDMSGLAGTQAAMTAAIQAAGQAGQQAGANATTGMTGAQTQATAMHGAQTQKDIEQMKIAGDIAKASIGVPPVGKDKVEGISGDGARINHGRDMDQRNEDFLRNDAGKPNDPARETDFALMGSGMIPHQQNDPLTENNDSVDVPDVSLSGSHWCEKFPNSTDTLDLSPDFKNECEAFLNALTNAGAIYNIASTRRPEQRAYLMHWSWKIAEGAVKPENVPALNGVSIDWIHRDKNGSVDIASSKKAAKLMVQGFGLVHIAALHGRHIDGLAIDVAITWTGVLKIIDADNKLVTISSTPRDGTNAKLWTVGKSYGVIKLTKLKPDGKTLTDPPHWSNDGR